MKPVDQTSRQLDLLALGLLGAGLALMFFSDRLGWGLTLLGASVFKFSLKRDFFLRLRSALRRPD